MLFFKFSSAVVLTMTALAFAGGAAVAQTGSAAVSVKDAWVRSTCQAKKVPALS